MSAKHFVTVSIIAAAIAAAAGSALAAGPSGSPSRISVKTEVLQARNDRTLQPAGEATQPFAVITSDSLVTRGEVRAETTAGTRPRRDDRRRARAELRGCRRHSARPRRRSRERSPGQHERRADARRRRRRPGRTAGQDAPEPRRDRRDADASLSPGRRVGTTPPAGSRQTPCPPARGAGRVGSPPHATVRQVENAAHEPPPPLLPSFARPRGDSVLFARGRRAGDDAQARQRLRRERHLRRPPAEVAAEVQRRRQGNAADQLHRRPEGDPDVRGRQRRQDRRRRHGARDRRVLHQRHARGRLSEAGADPGRRAAQERRLRGDQRALDAEGPHGLPGADGREPAVPPLPQQEDRQARPHRAEDPHHAGLSRLLRRRSAPTSSRRRRARSTPRSRGTSSTATAGRSAASSTSTGTRRRSTESTPASTTPRSRSS